MSSLLEVFVIYLQIIAGFLASQFQSWAIWSIDFAWFPVWSWTRFQILMTWGILESSCLQRSVDASWAAASELRYQSNQTWGWSLAAMTTWLRLLLSLEIERVYLIESLLRVECLLGDPLHRYPMLLCLSSLNSSVAHVPTVVALVSVSQRHRWWFWIGMPLHWSWSRPGLRCSQLVVKLGGLFMDRLFWTQIGLDTFWNYFVEERDFLDWKVWFRVMTKGFSRIDLIWLLVWSWIVDINSLVIRLKHAHTICYRLFLEAPENCWLCRFLYFWWDRCSSGIGTLVQKLVERLLLSLWRRMVLILVLVVVAVVWAFIVILHQLDRGVLPYPISYFGKDHDFLLFILLRLEQQLRTW